MVFICLTFYHLEMHSDKLLEKIRKIKCGKRKARAADTFHEKMVHFALHFNILIIPVFSFFINISCK